tara:strand:- start:129 stop:614 length:486 start_codon:yes stop_codon:yes gene_type:complete
MEQSQRRNGEDTVSHPEQLELRIDLGPMPTAWCTDPTALSLGLQSGRDDIVRGTETADGVCFDVVVGIKRGRSGAPDFKGPLVHGRPGDRFLYLSWGKVTAQSDHEMFRRLKLYLSPGSRKGWSSRGVSWEQVNQGSITTSVSGQGPDGTPHCGTARVLWE